jgi:hypothetical protein
VLADFPDDLQVLFALSRAGLDAAQAGNKTNNGDTVAYAKRTMQLLQAGKTFEKDKPVANKDEIVGGLNYLLGFLLQESQPAEAMNYLISAAQFEGASKKDPLTYFMLAGIYEKNEYTTLANQFNTSCKTPEQLATPECTTMKQKADQVVDHIIDALARAIAYSNSSPNPAGWAQARTAWTESLTNYYKYRNNGSDTGLKEFIASITAKPLPKPGDTIAPLTPSAPSSSTAPAQPNGTSGAATTGTSSTTKPGTTTTPASTKTTTTTTPAAKTPANGKAAATTQPTGKTSSAKTTPKRAHVSGKRG